MHQSKRSRHSLKQVHIPIPVQNRPSNTQDQKRPPVPDQVDRVPNRQHGLKY